MDIIDYEEFNRNLLLPQAYCETISTGENMASVLRSFNPEYDGQPLFSFKFDKYFELSYWMTIWGIDPVMGSDNCFYDELFVQQLDYKNRKIKELDKNINCEGRILIAEIDVTVRDGASEAESAGLIDINDCPPIDTWFYKSRNKYGRVLFAWIPHQYVELINTAAEVNCVDCLHWYDTPIQGLDQISSKRKATFGSFIKALFR